MEISNQKDTMVAESIYDWQPNETITLFNSLRFKRLIHDEMKRACGELFQIVNLVNNIKMVAKKAGGYDPKTGLLEKYKEDILKREAFVILTLPPHPNVVESYMVEKVKGKYHIFMEYVNGGDLRSFIEGDRHVNRTRKWPTPFHL